MNNEEKNLDGVELETAKESASEQPAVKKAASTPGGWKGLATWLKAVIIAAPIVIITAVVLLVVLLSGNGGIGGGGSTDGPGGGPSGPKASYTVSVVTKGGMNMSNLPVYIYELDDGSLGEMVDGGYGATGADGKVTFSLPKGGSYAARIDFGIPEGYEVKPFYPLLDGTTPITVTSSIISETSLAGVSYQTGNVIRNFSVKTTDGSTFTLSEVLKEKKAVLINFWYTTCTWCITEFPLMESAYQKYKDDLAIIALDPYQEDSLESIISFKDQYGLSFDVAKDYTSLSTAFNVTGYPTSVMIDRYGVITLIEPGAIVTERTFDCLFDYYTADDYEQKLISYAGELVPKIKPDDVGVVDPSSDDVADALEKEGESLGDVTYRNDEEDEYSWPFNVAEKDGISVLKSTNAGYENSYSQLIFDVYLEAGEVLAFDYFSSSEYGGDILYVIVNEKDIFSISGESEEWETCYAYVAEESAEYEIGLIFLKDSDTNEGDDCVYLNDLRKVTVEDIDRDTFIYRFAATNLDEYSNYQDYVDIVFSAYDAYYHVGAEDGPILFVDLMGYTRFNSEDYIYNLALGSETFIGTEYLTKLTQYSNYSINSELYGLCPVTEELYSLLIMVAEEFGSSTEYEKEVLKMCCYYDAYGTDGEQLSDPIKGLAPFSAFDAVESPTGSTEFPNSFTYNRVIMPRGFIAKFTPTTSGTYLIISDSEAECDAWIFTADGFVSKNAWLTYENVARGNTDANNCYMLAYLEAGEDYYINIAFYDVYGEGTINYRVERLGGEGYYRFSAASPGYFTALESDGGEFTETIAGGIEVELGSDGIWREKRTDGRDGSILYADFTNTTAIFSNQSIEKMIELGAFNFALTEDDQLILAYLDECDGDVDACREYLKQLWGDDYATYAEEYLVEEVLAGIYHGAGTDYTALAREFAAKKIVAGYNADLGETIAADDERIGCVIVTEELAELLQILMDKYTFEDVENSWTKLCYYSQYFSAATPK